MITGHDFLISFVRAEMVAILVLWAKVMFHYGKAAKAEWLLQGGTTKSLFREIAYPFWWAYRQMFSKLGLSKPLEKSAYETYTPYTPGVILRFAIFTTALGPVLGFFRLFTEPYNSPVTNSTLVLSTILLGFSLFGALAHLYVAHRTRPFRWMHVAFWFTLWIMLGPIILLLLLPTSVANL